MARQARKTQSVSVDQLELFDCFGMPAFCMDEGLSVVPDHAAALPASEVLAYASNDADDCDDDPLVTAPVIRRIIPASEAGPLPISGPVSIFHMSGKPVTVKLKRDDTRAFTKVQRDAGIIRCVRIQEQDTTEWIEREIARRARQRPPKPTKGAKTMSRALAELTGA